MAQSVESLFAAGDRPGALRQLKARANDLASVGNDALLELADVAQLLGHPQIALSMLNEAERRGLDPVAVEAARDLLVDDLGPASLDAYATDTESPTHDHASPDEAGDAPSFEASAADLRRFVHRFGGREDHHARQWYEANQAKGGYTPMPGPITPSLLQSHLDGAVTLGVYCLRADASVTFFALDLDIRKRALASAEGRPTRAQALREKVHNEGLELMRRAEALDLPLMLEDSGYKGRHLWGFLSTPLPAELVHRFGKALVRVLRPDDPDLDLEFFPKQAQLGPEGLGNLIKLPLGLHRRSGRWSRLLDASGQPADAPWVTLRDMPTISRDQLLDALAALRGMPAATTSADAPQHELRAPDDRTALPAEPAFTRDDLEHGEVATVLRGCPVLRALVEQALISRRLTYDERVVLTHALGHLERGTEAVNFIFGTCPEIPKRDWLKRRLRGSPVSCAKVRKRLPDLTIRVGCNCLFDTIDHYPSPVLYAQLVGPHPATDDSPLAPQDAQASASLMVAPSQQGPDQHTTDPVAASPQADTHEVLDANTTLAEDDEREAIVAYLLHEAIDELTRTGLSQAEVHMLLRAGLDDMISSAQRGE